MSWQWEPTEKLRATSHILSQTKNVFHILTVISVHTSLFRACYAYTSSRCTVTATYIARALVYSYIVTAIGATTLTGYRSSEDQDQCRTNPRTATPETASEERERRLQLRRNKREPTMPLRQRNIGRKG